MGCGTSPGGVVWVLDPEVVGAEPSPPPHPTPYLALHQHGHVHEHVVQLPDARFQLDDLVVSRLDLVQGLFGHLRVHLDLVGERERRDGWGRGAELQDGLQWGSGSPSGS